VYLWRFYIVGILSVACISAPVSVACAGAWLAPTGQGDIIASLSFSDTTQIFDAHNRLIPVPSGIR
jgi:hypothetical protein